MFSNHAIQVLLQQLKTLILLVLQPYVRLILHLFVLLVILIIIKILLGFIDAISYS